MPTMRHPYANTQYLHQSLSTDALGSWLRLTPDVEAAPQLPSASSQQFHSSSSQLFLPSSRPSKELPPVDVSVASFSSKSSPSHYVKHSSRLTLLLSGQEDGTCEPEYTNGATIEGILAVPRPSGLLSLQIRVSQILLPLLSVLIASLAKVEASMKLKETAGSGSSRSQIIDDLVFVWDAERNATFPSKITFRYTLPTHFMHYPTGERYRLPPTYHTYLHGVPGFNVDISYAVVVYITRNRSKANWWRKSTRCVSVLLTNLFSERETRQQATCTVHLQRIISTNACRTVCCQSWKVTDDTPHGLSIYC